MSNNDLETAIQAILAAQWAGADEPSPDELLELRAGLLEAEQRDRLLERAAASPDAIRAVLDARCFPDLEPSDPSLHISEIDVEKQWRGFQKRLRREETGPAPTRQRWALLASPHFAKAAAVSLLAMSLGLIWTLFVRRPSEPQNTPWPNMAIIELAPVGDPGVRSEGEFVRLRTESNGAALVLGLSDRRHFPAYELEILDAVGKSVWRSSSLRRVDGIFTLTLPDGFLPAGSYRLSLRGIDAERREILAIYALQVE